MGSKFEFEISDLVLLDVSIKSSDALVVQMFLNGGLAATGSVLSFSSIIPNNAAVQYYVIELPKTSSSCPGDICAENNRIKIVAKSDERTILNCCLTNFETHCSLITALWQFR